MPLYTPWFIRTITAIQLLMLIVELAVGGLAPIAFRVEVVSANVPAFNGFQTLSRNTTPNFWIGPETAFLINFGAKYTPCMREDADIATTQAEQQFNEESYVCCRQDPLASSTSCGRTTAAKCTSDGGAFQTETQCSLVPQCTNITMRPCCNGYMGGCSILTQEACDFLQGSWHSDKELCSETPCMENMCSSVGFDSATNPNQWYRFIVPIFLHVGIVHYILVAIFQLSIGSQVERNAGWLRTALIYFTSGIGGFIVSAIFVPNQPTMGASGSLFGFLGVLVVELFQSWQLIRHPWRELIKLLIITLIALCIGLLPWIDNFAHVGGFLFGLVAAVVFLPYIVFGLWDKKRKRFLLLLCIPLLIGFFLTSLIVFYKASSSSFCSWCHYLDCVPITSTFCDNSNLF